MKDMSGREILSAATLLILTVLIGVAPFLLLDVIHATTEVLLP
jgi:NADH:ubiquinone oxidoreductase subunit 4 (subunit M)